MNVAKIHGIGKSAYADLPAKIYKVVRITTFLMLAACLQAQAKGYSQGSITLSIKDAPLPKVFQAIETQSGYHFFYDFVLLQQAAKVSVEVKKATLDQVLAICFKNQPFTYSIQGKLIVVKEKEQPQKNESLATPMAAGVNIHGKVVDENGKPLSGVTVTIKGTKTATSTDEKGEFSVNTADKNTILIFTSVNMEAFEFKVNGKADLLVNLKTKTSQLDEVQIIAYGTTTERLSTGDVTTVKASDIEKQPVSNPMLALEGRVPGLFIQQSTGVPASGLTIRLQGQNSLSSGNDPLYVIDGVPYASQLLPNISGVFGILGSNGTTNVNAATGGGNPMAFLSPADIESISILKDADATAIYGSRAANGAILIITKKGKAGRTKVEVNCQDGWGKVARMTPLFNTTQYIQMRLEAKANAGAAIGSNDFDLNGTWDTTRYTDWEKVLIGSTTHYTDDQINVSGGNANTTFLVGGGYHKETTVFPGNLGDQKGNLHFNLGNASSNQRFRLQLSGTYVIDENKLMSTDLTQTALTLAPDAPPLYSPDGSLNWAQMAGNSTWTNPLSYLQGAYTVKTHNLIGNLVTSYELLPGLDVKLSAGYNDLSTNEVQIVPRSYFAPEIRPYFSGESIFGTEGINTWTVEPQVTYKRVIGGGVLDVLVGATALQTNSNMAQTLAYGFSSDQELYDMSAASNLYPYAQSIANVYKYTAGFSRVGYRWKERYLFDLTGRRDGSSRFGAANQFHDFGSASAAWIFSAEPFMRSALPFLSFGKLRASYGTTGNDQIGDYEYLALYNPVVANVGTTYQGATGLAPNGLNNPYLEWELTKKLQFGLDLGFGKDRVLLAGNYYLNRSSNQLQHYALPTLTGNAGILINFPALVQNNGWELTLTTVNIKRKDFSWTTGLNLTIPRNKLVSYPGLSTSTYADAYVVGQPVTIQKVYQYLGVNPATGIYQFASQNGQATSTPNYATDATAWVNPAPKYFGGLSNTVRYKRFMLDFLFQFVDQVGPNYVYGHFPGLFYSDNSGDIIANQPTWISNSWQAPGDMSLVQKVASHYTATMVGAFNSVRESTFAYSDASYVRLKNLSFFWECPSRWMQKWKLQGIRLYLQGQNLLTFTHYRGLDPENQSTLALPPLRVMTAGVVLIL